MVPEARSLSAAPLPGVPQPGHGRHDVAAVVADLARWPSALLGLLSDSFPRRVRRTAHRREQGCTGGHYSPLMAAVRPWESPDEAALCVIGDVTPSWWGYWCQVVAVPYTFDGKARTAYPDFLVRLADGRFILLEVKPLKVYERQRKRHDAIAAACGALGLTYHMVTDDWLAARPRSANAALLHAFWDITVSDKLVRHVRGVVGRDRPETLAGLMASCSMDGVPRGAALACALRGAFRLDIESGPLGGGSRVREARRGTDRFLLGAGAGAMADGSIAARI